MESNHKPILFAMVIGLIVGVVVNIAQPDIGGVGDFLAQLNAFIGDLFLRGLIFTNPFGYVNTLPINQKQ